MPPRIGHGPTSYRRTFIRAWREYRQLSLDRLIDRLEELGLEMSKASLSRIETAQQAYTQPILEAIAEALGVEPKDLLMHDPNEKSVGLADDIRSLPQDKQRAVEEIVSSFKRTAAN